MRRGFSAHMADEPIGLRDVTDAISAPFTLAAGHPYRGSRCLLCGMMIGGREARLATATIWFAQTCACGSVPTISYLICAEHDIDETGGWIAEALTRFGAHHAGGAA